MYITLGKAMDYVLKTIKKINTKKKTKTKTKAIGLVNH